MTRPEKQLFDLRTERLGPLPIVNRFIDRIGIDVLLEKYVPTDDPRCALPYAKGLGVLLRTIIVEREPIYRLEETVRTFSSDLFGVSSPDFDKLTDDRLGRALDKLFDADRAALLTDVAVAVARRFALRFDQLHNDSTTIRFAGQYRPSQKGRRLRGRRAPWITFGYSKDHRPDLKQLLLILTTSSDGGVPIHFRCADGNTNDSRTHIETWEALHRVTGRPDFLYVADSKLCSRDNMDYIDHKQGRFVTVLPRSRSEDKFFRKWIQTNQPTWELAWDRPNPRRKYGPRDRWWVFRSPLPSREAWPVLWVYSSLLERHQEQARLDRMATAFEDLTQLKQRLANPRTRLRRAAEIDRRVELILRRRRVTRYIKVKRIRMEEHIFRQRRPGRPGPHTDYRRITKKRYDIVWSIDQDAIDYDRKSDGMYPLLTNDKSLTPLEILKAHKGQPTIEKRFKQCKTVHEIAPVFLKNPGRIEAFFLLYFLALLVQAIIEREIRNRMRVEKLGALPLYPEERMSKYPTTDQVLRLFSLAEGNVLLRGNEVIQFFQPRLTNLQSTVLRLLGVSPTSYRIAAG